MSRAARLANVDSKPNKPCVGELPHVIVLPVPNLLHCSCRRAQAHALQQMDVDVKVKAAKATMLKNQRKYVTGTLNYTKADAATEEHVR